MSTSQTTKLGDILKCPACGAVVSKTSAKCPECGHEFSNIGANDTAQALLEELKHIDRIKISDEAKAKRKAQTIQNFPVPNTKEDIIEMLTICHSNAEAEPKDSPLKQAWQAKTDQLIKKSKIALKGDHDVETVISGIMQNKEAKKKRKMIKWGSIIGIILVICGIQECNNMREQSSTKDINAQITSMKSDINKEISAGDFEAAFSHLDSLNSFMRDNDKNSYDFDKIAGDSYQKLVIALIRNENLEDAARVGLDYRTKIDNDYNWKKSSVYKVLIQECEAQNVDVSPLN